MLEVNRQVGQSVVCNDVYVWVTHIDLHAGAVKLAVQGPDGKSVRQIESNDSQFIRIVTEDGSPTDR